jgi:hypothetical protein
MGSGGDGTPRVKGSNLVHVVKVLRGNRELALTRLAPAQHKYLEERVLVSSWYPETDLLALLQALVAILPAPQNRWEVVGRMAAANDLGGLYKHLLRADDPARTLEICGVMWKSYHDTGTVDTALDGPSAAYINLRGFGLPSEAMCGMIGGYAVHLTEQAGGKRVQVEKLLCRLQGAEFCRWRVAWKPAVA